MKQSLKLAGLAVLLGVAAGPAAGAGEDQDRRDRDPVRPRRRSRPAIARRLSARGQGSRRQDGRQGRRGRRRRRRVEAGRRRHQGQGTSGARQGRLRGRADLLQHPAGHSPAGHREQDVPDQPECRAVELRRQGMLARSSMSPRTRTTRCTRSSARWRRIAATSASMCWCRTIRPARIPPPASSSTTRARSPKRATCRSARSTSRSS